MLYTVEESQPIGNRFIELAVVNLVMLYFLNEFQNKHYIILQINI